MAKPPTSKSGSSPGCWWDVVWKIPHPMMNLQYFQASLEASSSHCCFGEIGLREEGHIEEIMALVEGARLRRSRMLVLRRVG